MVTMSIEYRGKEIFAAHPDGTLWTDDVREAYAWDSYDSISSIAQHFFRNLAIEVFGTKNITESQFIYRSQPDNRKLHYDPQLGWH